MHSDHTLVAALGTMWPVARCIGARHHVALVSNNEVRSSQGQCVHNTQVQKSRPGHLRVVLNLTDRASSPSVGGCRTADQPIRVGIQVGADTRHKMLTLMVHSTLNSLRSEQLNLHKIVGKVEVRVAKGRK